MMKKNIKVKKLIITKEPSKPSGGHVLQCALCRKSINTIIILFAHSLSKLISLLSNIY